MKFLPKITSLLAMVAMLGGCSNIGKINGQDVSRVAGENPNPTYCQQNPAICILGAAAVVGGTALVIHEVTKGDKTAAAAASSGGGGSE